MIRSIPDRVVKLDAAMEAGEHISRGHKDKLTMAWIGAYRAVKGVAGALKRLGDVARERAGIEGGGPFGEVQEEGGHVKSTANRLSTRPDEYSEQEEYQAARNASAGEDYHSC